MQLLNVLICIIFSHISPVLSTSSSVHLQIMWVLITLESEGRDSPHKTQTALQNVLFLHKYVSETTNAFGGAAPATRYLWKAEHPWITSCTAGWKKDSANQNGTWQDGKTPKCHKMIVCWQFFGCAITESNQISVLLLGFFFFLWICKNYFNSVTISSIRPSRRTHLHHASGVTLRLSQGTQALWSRCRDASPPAV